MKTLFSLLTLSVILVGCTREYVQNPDPNHTHADFAVWIEGQQLDLSDAKYMSEAIDTDATGYAQDDNGYLHRYLHLHDDIGHVLHRHKPGLTLGEFFASIGFSMTQRCFQLDTGINVCPESGKQWRMYRNNPSETDAEWHEIEFSPEYVFVDMDQILLTYGGDDGISTLQREQQMKQMTDDACRFSKTCPWRGEPPAENCVADPEIPCVAPLE